MPRPTRIEYEDAFYHVMNRGRARNNIFFKETHYLTFLKVLEETCERFDCTIHSYCLMPNHYHILVQTLHPNLSRAMKHINGIYTQRFNKLQKIDGPLFRGRYKAILVDEDDYLLELSRYIHMNPIQTKNNNRRLAKELKDYRWSSYQNYLQISRTPKWLNKELTLSKFKNDKDLLKRYQLFVETEKENNELEEFFNKKNQEMILGSNSFKEKILIQNLIDKKSKQDQLRKEINNRITVEEIIKAVAKIFNVNEQYIVKGQRGRQNTNIARGLSMYLIQQIKNYTLKEISEIFELNHYGSVSKFLFVIKGKIEKGLLTEELKNIKANLKIEE